MGERDRDSGGEREIEIQVGERDRNSGGEREIEIQVGKERGLKLIK